MLHECTYNFNEKKATDSKKSKEDTKTKIKPINKAERKLSHV